MTTIDKEELKALANLEHNADFELVLGWFRKSAEQAKNRHCLQTNEREAGAAVELDAIIKQAGLATRQYNLRMAGPAGSDHAQR